MIRLVEGASRQRTPNEIALSLVLAAFTLMFLIVTVTLWPWPEARNSTLPLTKASKRSKAWHGHPHPGCPARLLDSHNDWCAFGSNRNRGMDRALRANIIAKSGKAVEIAGDLDTLLLDKTGTITLAIGAQHGFCHWVIFPRPKSVDLPRYPARPMKPPKAKALSSFNDASQRFPAFWLDLPRGPDSSLFRRKPG